MIKNSPNFRKDMTTNPRSSTNSKYKLRNPHWNTFWSNCQKTKNFESGKKCLVIMYKGVLIRLTANFSPKTMQARRQWDATFKPLKEKKNCQPRILHLAKLHLTNKKEIKTFQIKQKLKEFVTSRHILQEMLQGILQTEMKGQ